MCQVFLPACWRFTGGEFVRFVMKSVKSVCNVFFLLLPNHNYNNHVVMENRDSGLLYCVQLYGKHYCNYTSYRIQLDDIHCNVLTLQLVFWMAFACYTEGIWISNYKLWIKSSKCHGNVERYCFLRAVRQCTGLWLLDHACYIIRVRARATCWSGFRSRAAQWNC